jgi:hypothetical protein
MDKKNFKPHFLYLLIGFFALILSSGLLLPGFFAKADVSYQIHVEMNASPTRISGGQSSYLSWNTTLYFIDDGGSSNLISTGSCEGSSSFQDTVGTSGSATVSPVVSTYYNVSVSCEVLANPSYPYLGYITVYGSNSAQVRVGSGSTYSVANQPAYCQLGIIQTGDIGQCPNNNYFNQGVSYCPSGTLVCGTKSDASEPNMMNKLLCCTLSQEAINAGVTITDPTSKPDGMNWGPQGGYFVDPGPNNGGAMECLNSNDVMVGGEWSKNNQLDFGICKRLTGVEVVYDSQYEEAGGNSINHYCASNALVSGGSNGPTGNDSWIGRYCATTYQGNYVPPPPCSIDTFACNSSDTLGWQTTGCTDRTISSVNGSFTVGAAGNTQGEGGIAYTLTADGQTATRVCPVPPPTATISSPASCTAQCNVAVSWTSTNVYNHNPSIVKIYKNGNFLWNQTGNTPGSATDGNMPQGTYQYCIRAVNSDWSETSNLACTTTQVNPPSVSPPTASLTVNNQHAHSGNPLTLNVGDYPNYEWHSTNGTSYPSTWSVSPSDGCGWGGTSGAWGNGTTADGSKNTDPIQSCMAGRTFTLTYNVTNSVGTASDSVVIYVPPAPVCGSSPNNCDVGTSNDVADGSCTYDWQCSNGGVTKACSTAKPSVDGGWSNWTTCSGGNQTRTCNNPSPSCGGLVCSGSSSQSCGVCTNGTNEDCGTGTCKGTRTCTGGAWGSCSYPGSGTSCDDSNSCTNSDHCDGTGGCTGTASGNHSICQSSSCVSVANTSSACTSSCSANQDCGACTTLTLRPATSGFSASPSGPANYFLTVTPSQTFYAFVDYGQINDAIILPNFGGSYTCTDSGVWLGTARRFNCTAPASANSYSYTTGTNSGTSSNICVGSTILGTVTVSSAPKPHIVLSPTTFTFTGVSGGPTPPGQTLNIRNTGTAALNWSGSTDQSWCHISSASGSISAGSNSNITVSVDAPSNVGSFGCTITISDPNADNLQQTANVTYTVTPGSCPVGSVGLSPATINVSQTSTASAPANFSGGSFQSSNSGIASVSGSTVTGQSAGSATISGTGWTYVINGATGCSLAGSVLTVNPNIVSSSASLTADNSTCDKVTLSWSGFTGTITGYKIYRNTSDSIPGTPIATVASSPYTDSGRGAGSYYYWVTAYNGGGESSPPTPISKDQNGNGLTPPIGTFACLADLGNSDKDIASVNGTAVNGNSACNSSTDALPTTVSLKIGDNLGFRINLCNEQGEVAATGITVTDTMTNLQQVTGSPNWSAKYNGSTLTYDGACAATPNPARDHYCVSGTAPNQTLTFNLTAPADNIAGKVGNVLGGMGILTFTAQLTVPSGTTATQSRFQNSFRAKYNGAQTVNRATPWLLFYTGKGVPVIIEVP